VNPIQLKSEHLTPSTDLLGRFSPPLAGELFIINARDFDVNTDLVSIGPEMGF
jgi:hypothetical protein